MFSELNTKGCCLICLKETEEINENCDDLCEKEMGNIVLMKNLCKLLKIKVDNTSTQLSLTENTTDIVLCEVCRKISENLSGLFQKLETLAMEVTYHQGSLKERISEAYKQPEVVQNYSRLMTNDSSSLVTLAKVDDLRKRILKKCSSSVEFVVSEVRLTKLELEHGKRTGTKVKKLRHQKSTIGQLMANQIMKDTEYNEFGELKRSTGNKGLPLKIRFECKFCRRTYSNKYERMIHMRKNHSYKWETKCDICHMKFNKPSQYKLHREKAHFCKICHIQCKDREEYKLHQTHLHENTQQTNVVNGNKALPNQSTTKTKANSLVCSVSNADNETDEDFAKNLHKISALKRRKSQTSQLNYKKDYVLDKTRKIYKCILNNCGKEYKSYRNFNSHRQVVHLQIRFTCNFCNRKFTQQRGLNSHKKVCPVKNGSVRRQRKAVKESRIDCDICGKKFTTKKGMKKHQKKVHFGAENSECATCGKSFSTRSALKRHQKEVHDKSLLFTCQICKKSWNSRQKYYTHMKKCGKREKTSQDLSNGDTIPTMESEAVVMQVEAVDVKPIVKR